MSVSAFGVDHGVEISKFDPLKWGAVRGGFKQVKALRGERTKALGVAEHKSLRTLAQAKSAKDARNYVRPEAATRYHLERAVEDGSDAYKSASEAAWADRHLVDAKKQLKSDVIQAGVRTTGAGALAGGGAYGANKWRKNRKGK